MPTKNHNNRGLEKYLTPELREDFNDLYYRINTNFFNNKPDIDEEIRELSQKYQPIPEEGEKENYVQMAIIFQHYLNKRTQRELEKRGIYE